MTTKSKAALTTFSAISNLYHGEEGLSDVFAERGYDPSIKIWNNTDADWTDVGTVIVRSVSGYSFQHQAFLEQTEKVLRILNHLDILEWNTHRACLRSLEKHSLPTIPTA